ncbi:DUF3953 domain-containing protein [Planococcus sp. Sa1BUA13]|uniref:DUF3953 domain-containing protein n=1 Tax=Planococcus wigleyi TaxID=2762216 RepID=A0ABR8WB13_9BACL|nr:DUF3953 domain-containing protein [Planococcus wigleyi]
MLKISRIIFQIVGVGLAAYVLWSQNFELMPYVMLTLGILMLAAGFERIQKDKKEFFGYMFVVISLFIFFVSAQGFNVNY